MDKIEYKDCLIAFVDILGFSNMTLLSESDTNIRNKLFNILKFLNAWQTSGPNRWDASELIKLGVKINIDNIKSSFECTTFSDSLVVSVECNEAELKDYLPVMIANLLLIGKKLLLANCTVRGGISYGKLFYSKECGILLGPAMIEAHELESKRAVYSRIILSDKITNAVVPKNLVTNYSDGVAGFSQLDYYRFSNNYTDEIDIANIKSFIEEELNKTYYNKDVSAKYNWLKNEFNKLTIVSKHNMKI